MSAVCTIGLPFAGTVPVTTRLPLESRVVLTSGEVARFAGRDL